MAINTKKRNRNYGKSTGSSKTSKYYAKNKAARDKKRAYDRKYSKKASERKNRSELNKYNRKKGTYGNGDGKDASHKGGKIVGFESQSSNRARNAKGSKKPSRKKK